MLLCPDDKLTGLLASLQAKDGRELRNLNDLLADYPDDARLHFLKGSLQAGAQDFVGARASMYRAVEIAPDYAVARFQLGLLLLSSGEAGAAEEMWDPLQGLPADNYLRLFATGLRQMARDEFEGAIRALQEGLARNQENLAMNHDMQLVIDRIREKLKDGNADGTSMSTADFILQQSVLKSRLH